MNLLDKLNGQFPAPRLTGGRIVAALLIAMAADGLQVLFPVPPAPEIIDVMAMGLTIALLGFHVLLLPTFIVELIPIVDMLPTWTGCVIAVIALKKRSQQGAAPPIISTAEPPKPEDKPVIDI